MAGRIDGTTYRALRRRVCLVAALSLIPSQAAAGGPWLSALFRNAPRSGFAAVKTGQRLERELLFDAFKSKTEIRVLGEGGPIAQPSFFAPFASDGRLAPLVKKFGTERIENNSASELLLGKDRFVTIDHLADHIGSGRVALPLAFKPNGGAHGRGLFFLKRDAAGRLVVTMAYTSPETFFDLGETRDVINALQQLGVHRVDVSEETATAQIELADQDLKRVLHTIRAHVTGGDQGHYGAYDAGMVESMLPLFRYQQSAYEVRLKFEGTYAKGVTHLVKYAADSSHGYWGGMETPGSFARLGASPFFSNQTGRGTLNELPAGSMYDPLYESFRIAGRAQPAFAQHVDDLVVEHVHYMLDRLHASGIFLDEELTGQLDLGWLPPAGQGLPPTPVLIEAVLGRAKAIGGPVIVKKPKR